MTLLQARTTKVVLSGALLLSGAWFLVPCGFASEVPVVNPSFEILPTGGFSGTPCSSHPPENVGCHLTDNEIPDWTHSGPSHPFTFGQFQPGTQLGNKTFFDTLPAGDMITSAYVNAGTISQTVSTTVQAGLDYIFTVEIGHRNDHASHGTADLLLSGGPHLPQTIDATGTTASSGNWSTFTATFVGNSSNFGDHITIQLSSDGLQGNFDSVHLSAVPEPGTLLLFGSGLLLVGMIIVRRKQHAKAGNIGLIDVA